MNTTEAEYLATLPDSEIDRQISELVVELRGLDRSTIVYDAAVADLRDRFDERRRRRSSSKGSRP